MDTLVETTYGRIRGKKEGGVVSWKGIPYAMPPVGELRFHPPQPPKPWSGIREAVNFGDAAPQPKMAAALLQKRGISTNEDCLYLNVWSPSADNKRRPVMFWIHGGAYFQGTGANGMFNGESFAAQGDIVLVTLNYRLGPLGYLQLAHLGGEEFAFSGNCGTLDQIAGLEWVRDNIEAFGGDPNKVTIFGQSSGSGSVSVLMASPKAKGLFHRAILQSWSTSSTGSIPFAEKVTAQLLREVGISPDVNAMHKLMEMPADQLAQATVKLPYVSIRPVEDGIVLPKAPISMFQQGSVDDIPVMAGSTRDEYWKAALNEPVLKQTDEEIMLHYFQEQLGPFWPEVSPYYLREDEAGTTLSEKMKRLMTFHRYSFSMMQLATQLSERLAPTWIYRFDWRSSVQDGRLGACHGMEVPFVFNTINTPEAKERVGESPDREAVARQVHQAWIAFARNGDPNNEVIPHWPSYNVQHRPTMIFNSESDLAFNPDQKERELWEEAVRRLGITHMPMG
ncbi:carboxylesterase/lipase family protein [Neobacillus sp. 3P2-tot-E-2]|uniref:carboxylesterase/lipase family protein n=1 Tax=Neobacillus sp. 3P2-tot-E-2 TaxID=3132212 RepID=UPI0039A025C7